MQSRFMRFACVGVIGTLTDFVLFYMGYSVVGLALIPANIISYSIGLIVAFLCNRRWTFHDGVMRSKHRIWLSLFYGYIGLILNTACVWLAAHIMSIAFAKIIAVLIVLAYNYLTNKYLVFRAP